MGTGQAVRAAGVRKSFDLDRELPVRALRGVDLEVDGGDFVAIMGPSGCGKSTLLHVLAGIDVPDDGAVEVGGVDLIHLDEDDRAIFRRSGIGIVLQDPYLLDGLSVIGNVALAALVNGADRTEADRRARESLNLAGVGNRTDHAVGGLSGGERQRVAVARAVINRPPVLLADEPTGSLDSAGRDEILDLFQRLHGLGHTIAVVTHDPVVARAATRTVVMVDGRIVDADTVEAGEGGTRLEPRRR